MARNDYECEAGHRFEHMRMHGDEKPTICTVEGCNEAVEIIWDCEPGDYFGTMGIIDRL
jgi:hypothetical protein